MSDQRPGPETSRPAPERSQPHAARSARVGANVGRLTRTWKHLPRERRLAVFASLGLFATLFLPWYQETVIARGTNALQNVSVSLTGWGAFSFVEAAVLLVALSVIALIFVRAEGHPFRVPFGDGGVITAAGLWTCVLIVWRIFDKQGTSSHAELATTSGIEWGIFVALGVAAFLAYAGSEIRARTGPENLQVEPAAPRREQAQQRRRRRTADADADWSAEAGSGSEADEIRPRRRRVERPDPGLFESVDTEWPERPTEPRLTRRRMTDEELRAERLSDSASPGVERDPPSPPESARGDDEPTGETRTRQMTPPSTPAARRARDADDQLTIPLERDD